MPLLPILCATEGDVFLTCLAICACVHVDVHACTSAQTEAFSDWLAIDF